MQQAMQKVERACFSDVNSLCRYEHPFSVILSAPLSLPLELPSMLDQMISSALAMSQESSPGFYMVLGDSPAQEDEEEHEQKPKLNPKEQDAEKVLDSMVSTMVEQAQESASADEAETQPAFDPMDMFKRIAEHGHQILASDQVTEDRRRLARRLTQVSPETHFTQRRLPLPFGCPINRCLMSAFEQGVVSPPCNDALRQAERIEQVEVSEAMLHVARESEAFLSFALLYGILALATLLMLHRRFRKLGEKRRADRRLTRRILQAVYSQPQLKAAVRANLDGQDLGMVPPLPPHILQRMGGKDGGSMMKKLAMCKAVKLVVLLGVLVLAFVNPLLAMPVLCMVMAARCIVLTLSPAPEPVDCCRCCCCGRSTDDVKKGKPLTKVQACCACCNGQGVCGPACIDCCGLNPDSPCDCCADGCCACCSSDTPNVKSCTCCCCGLNSDDAKKGKISSVQACCMCCQGTGTCSDACISCCGMNPDGACDCCADGCCACCSGGSSPGESKKDVYQAVLLQIV